MAKKKIKVPNISYRNLGVTLRIMLFCALALLLVSYALDYLQDLTLRDTLFFIVAIVAAILGLLFLYLRHIFIKPIKQIIKATAKTSQGSMGHRISLKRGDEIGVMVDSINQMTDSLEQRLGQLSHLNEISREATRHLDLKKVLSLILDKAVEIEKADSGSIMLMDDKGEELRVKACFNMDEEIARVTKVRVGEGIAGWVAKEAKPLLLINGVTFSGTRDLKDAVSIPIMLEDKVVGVLNLNNKADAKHSFSQNDLEFLTTLANQASSFIHNAQLFERLRHNYFSIIQALAAAIDAKDPYTHGHSARVAEYAMATATVMGLPTATVETIQAAGYLHDVGKIGIPELILTKPGKLTDEEFAIIKTHPEISARILSPVTFNGEVATMVRYHHERYDGSGYPDGVKGQNIPLEARILAVADSFDAMTSDRPYRPALDYSVAKQELVKCSGTQFDPEVAAKFIEAVEQSFVVKQEMMEAEAELSQSPM